MNKKKPILIDLDGVVADFSEAYYMIALNEFPKLYSALPTIDELKEFYYDDNIPGVTPELRQMSADIVNHPRIFKDLYPIGDAIEGVKFLKDLSKREIFFVSAPHTTNFHSYNQKAEWIDRYFGSDWVKRLMLVRDKTLVDGVILIDDKPQPMGEYPPKWEHIVYHQPYNRFQNEVKGKYRLMDWSDKSVEQLVNYIDYPSWR